MKREFAKYGTGHLTPLKITVIYALAGGAWILFSDTLLAAALGSSFSLTSFQVFKGWLFISVTALMLYALIKKGMSSLSRSERLHQESERRFHLFIETADDAIVVVEAETGRILNVNRKAGQLFGRPAGELIGADLLQLHPGGDREIYRKVYLDHAGQERALSESLFVCDSRGQAIPVELSTTVMEYEGKRIMHCIFHDITRRRHMEERLRETLEEYEIIFENALVGIAFARDRIVERGNRKCEEIFGYCRGEVIGRSTEMLYPSREDFERHGQEIHSRLSAGEHYSGEVLLRKKDRSLFWCGLFGKALDPSDLSKGIIWIIEDITVRKQAEEALRASREYARNIIDSSLDMIIAVDNDRTITEFNRAACETFGYEREEIVGKHVDALYADPKAGQEVHRTVLRNVRYIQEVFNRRKNGEIFPSFLSASVLFSAENEVVGVMGISRDITERKRVEEELLKARKLDSLGVLAGGIAHDFNNILTAIMGNISLALFTESWGPEVRKRLTDAENACLRAKELTGKLLTFSRGGAPVMRTASIAELIKEVVRFALVGSNVRYQFAIPDDLWPVEIDEEQISQVVHNLIINAIEAMPGGGTLTVAAENLPSGAPSITGLGVEKYVKLSVSDQGYGIPAEHLQGIFDPYFTTKQHGSGLGLSVCYSIIKGHNGVITVESKPGRGTTFYLYLPASPAAVSPQKGGREYAGQRQGRVLFMDDEEGIREIARSILQSVGYIVEVAEEGAAAIDLYRNARESGNPFDVVIMDLTIPGAMGGREAMQKLREIDPQVKAIVSSGYSHDPVMANYREYGFREVILKPYTAKELSDAVHKVVSDAAL
ncbi:MAG: PAS domain S-box protein [Alphaproteobacteria bacterium]|uniref:histidine kinase n=1 Tax=Candidatus Nitrobium versatile TaxID=2884831 RepID=A0A953SI64_9BACT|nr:PAS domain S-box protein [Candidatus Nitrobium versatile]